MPQSRYVSASRLMIMLRYVAAAAVALQLVLLLFEVLSAPRALRRWVVPIWLVGFPLGAWLAWRKSGS